MNRIHHWYCQSSSWKRRVDNELLPLALAGTTLDEPALEIGPGPGVTTDYLSARIRSLTALERDPLLAKKLRERFSSTNVRVIEGDATAMPFESGSFRTVFCFTMLHHVPSPALQDRVIAEAFRVLAPGRRIRRDRQPNEFAHEAFSFVRHYGDRGAGDLPRTAPPRGFQGCPDSGFRTRVSLLRSTVVNPGWQARRKR